MDSNQKVKGLWLILNSINTFIKVFLCDYNSDSYILFLLKQHCAVENNAFWEIFMNIALYCKQHCILGEMSESTAEKSCRKEWCYIYRYYISIIKYLSRTIEFPWCSPGVNISEFPPPCMIKSITDVDFRTWQLSVCSLHVIKLMNLVKHLEKWCKYQDKTLIPQRESITRDN